MAVYKGRDERHPMTTQVIKLNKKSATITTSKGRHDVKVKVTDLKGLRDILNELDSRTDINKVIEFYKPLLGHLEYWDNVRRAYAPTKYEDVARKDRVADRKAIASSPKHQRWIEFEEKRMISHPGFMSNSPF